MHSLIYATILKEFPWALESSIVMIVIANFNLLTVINKQSKKADKIAEKLRYESQLITII